MKTVREQFIEMVGSFFDVNDLGITPDIAHCLTVIERAITKQETAQDIEFAKKFATMTSKTIVSFSPEQMRAYVDTIGQIGSLREAKQAMTEKCT